MVSTDEFSIQSHSLQGQLLTLDLQYTGGCEEHDFEVWWGGVTSASDPPIVPLELQHDAHGDACEALIEEQIVVDLSALDDVPSSTPNLRLQLVVGEGGTSTLVEVSYDRPGSASAAPADALSIDTECGTIQF